MRILGKLVCSLHMIVKQTTQSKVRRHKHLQALCDLSDASSQINPAVVNQLVQEAPDPETALRDLFSIVDASSPALKDKWRQLIYNSWTEGHPHLPNLIDLPIAASDISDIIALQEAQIMLRLLKQRPAAMIAENQEWLLNSDDAFYIASHLPSYNRQPLIRFENEWQYLILRRLRATLQGLRLIRRVKDQLVVVKSRYQRFNDLPAIQQYYLLWHTEAYHIDWQQFSAIWGEYLKIIQEYLPLLWGLNEGTLPDIPHDVRQWNQDIFDTYQPLWDQEGLLNRPRGHTALLTMVRLHSLPTAITQVVMKDLLERYGLVYGRGNNFSYSRLGIDLLSAERGEDLPCALDILK